MENIRKYLHESLGFTVNVAKLPDSQVKKLPMYLAYGYTYYLLELDGQLFILAYCGEMPKTAGQLKKQAQDISHHLGMRVVFAMDTQSAGLKRRMIQDKINFIVPGNQLYLPELLIDLKENIKSMQTYPTLLSPSAQALLLFHLQVERLEGFSFKEIADKLGYSAKTITKAAGELKAKNLCEVLGTKEKQFKFNPDRKVLWEQSQPQMQQPVSKVYYVNRMDGANFCQSHDTALAHYTFLADTGKQAYAIGQSEFDDLKEKGYWEYLDETEGEVRLEIWKYNPRILSQNGYIDPLSLYLCYKHDSNERVEAEINELIQKMIW